MGKLEKMMARDGANALESVGSYRVAGPAPMSGPSPPPDPAARRLDGVTRSRDAVVIPLGRIRPDPGQPRKEFGGPALEQLAESLRTRGQLQPIRVRWDEGVGSYVIVCGERRWRAAGAAGLAALECVVMDRKATDAELTVIQLVENALREDLKPIEQAKAYQSLVEANGWTTRQVAAELAVDQSSVVQALKLLDLPPAVQERVEEGALAPSVAYEVSKLPDADAQTAMADRVLSTGMTRAETRDAVRRSPGRGAGGRGAAGRKAKVATSRKFTRAAGYTVTVECARGVDPEGIRAALAEVVARLDAEKAGQS